MIPLWLALPALAEPPTPAEAPSAEAPPAEAPSAEAPPEPTPAEPTPAEPPPTDGAELEVVVWGDLAIDQARDRIAGQMEALGWRVRGRRGDGLVFAGPEGWMGKATFHDDGSWTFSRSAVSFGPPAVEPWSQDPRHESADPLEPRVEVGAGPTFERASRRKVDAARQPVIEQTRDEVAEYVRVVRRTAFEEQLAALPERLDRLWSEGVPLDGGAPLPDPAARRRAVLDFWASRVDGPEGRRTCAAVEAWIAANWSGAPPTDAERAEFEPRRADGRRLP